MSFLSILRRRGPGFLIAFVLIAAGACAQGPPTSFGDSPPPPAPDYARDEAWLALPGDAGLGRSTPAGLAAIREAEAQADVFFIPPTTASTKAVWNAAWDVSDADAPLNAVVSASQVSAFNGCCRLYAPRYRQATLPGLDEPRAMDLAYDDIARAFRQFIQERNQDRPFILASHSQGTAHAIRLLQQEIVRTPLQDRLVAAYLIGGYVPSDFADFGLPVCDAPRQTGCVLSWNAGKIGSLTARIVIHDRPYWWRGEMKTTDHAPALCVNPLTWRAGDTDEPAPAADNLGSLPLPQSVEGDASRTLPALDPRLTGARCRAGMLEVDLVPSAGDAYADTLTRWAGSYHLNDYGLFYGALRTNAVDRVEAWRGESSAEQASAGHPSPIAGAGGNPARRGRISRP